MDKTQAFDPNRTAIGGDMLRTQAMSAAPTAFDPNKTGVVNVQVAPPGVSVRITPGREATMANGPAMESFLVEVVAGDGVQLPGAGVSGARTPLNLCLVIDRSGSMEGAPLEYVKQACSYVVDMLSPNDVLSIVTFEEIVEVLMAPQRVTNKQAIKDGIARLQVGNTTNLYDGLSLALQQITSQLESNRATRMIVLSDGDPTAGIKDFSALVAHAGEIKARGISVTFLGFGPDYNEELLAAMAKKATGNYYYIPQPQLIPEIFRTELDKLMTVAAQNLSLNVQLSRWVRLRSASGQSLPPTDKDFTLALNDLERGQTLQQVFSFDFQNHPLGWYRVAAGQLTYDDTTTGKRETQDIDFIIEFSADSAAYSVPVNPVVSSAAQVSEASRTVEKTIMGLKSGQITVMGAVQELQKTQMMLVQDGRLQEAQEVTLAMRALQTGDTGGAEKTLMGTVVNLDQGKKAN